MDKDKFYMKQAENAAEGSNCIRRKVGACLVGLRGPYVTGCNTHLGQTKGQTDCQYCYRHANNVPSGEELDKCCGLHAEQSVVLNAYHYGLELKGAVLYVTTLPCSHCARIIIAAGIQRVIYKEEYDSEFTKMLFEQNGVLVEKM